MGQSKAPTQNESTEKANPFQHALSIWFLLILFPTSLLAVLANRVSCLWLYNNYFIVTFDSKNTIFSIFTLEPPVSQFRFAKRNTILTGPPCFAGELSPTNQAIPFSLWGAPESPRPRIWRRRCCRRCRAVVLWTAQVSRRDLLEAVLSWFTGVGKCPFFGGFEHHQDKYLLEIISPIVGWCLIGTFTNPWFIDVKGVLLTGA